MAISTVADHIIPVSQGGTWSMDNGQGACDPCHNWKRAAIDKKGDRGSNSSGIDPLRTAQQLRTHTREIKNRVL
jgi:5-methylcytosine-specific restriction endonuclease McrA